MTLPLRQALRALDRDGYVFGSRTMRATGRVTLVGVVNSGRARVSKITLEP